jgi:hypothetical protein
VSEPSTKSRGCLGCFVVVVVVALILGGYFGIRSYGRSSQLKPFAAHLDDYSNRVGFTSSSQDPYVSGKVMTIDGASGKIDYLLFALPKELRATTPDEVKTVVVLTWRETLAGTYTSGAKGYVATCDVEIVDMANKLILGGQQFSGPEPPSTKTSKGDWHGAKPTSQVVDYISGLPRNAGTAATTTTTEATTTTTALNKKWGAAAEVNGLRITVSVPATEKGVHVETSGVRDGTKKIIMAEVVLENTGSTPHSYYASDFTLYDTWDKPHAGDNNDSSGDAVGKPALRSGYLQPGEKIDRYLAYVVPADAAADTIEYDVHDPTSGSLTESVIWGY